MIRPLPPPDISHLGGGKWGRRNTFRPQLNMLLCQLGWDSKTGCDQQIKMIGMFQNQMRVTRFSQINSRSLTVKVHPNILLVTFHSSSEFQGFSWNSNLIKLWTFSMLFKCKSNKMRRFWPKEMWANVGLPPIIASTKHINFGNGTGNREHVEIGDISSAGGANE